ncbi:MAG: hypothetical protein HLUCCX10_12680 [Algoriphagus marincola HL-49]|uniref:Uncharacterized protein n=1 Tax=Algoriphagus marincola HL-49 TaxID=1305737 RepID=A0A0P7YFY8_9BACT|nr:MAG: hypothetical protein HLUCCX10_12680 [Algoriphagus marincola HL-49]
MNRILLLIAYRCYDTKAETYSGEFFQNNESLARIFKVSQKQINTLLQRLASENENWISIRNTQSPHRRIKLTNKTKELIYLETESILENPDILLGTIGNSNLNQNFPPLGTIGNSHSNQNFTQKRTRKETIKELSKSDKERIQKILASGGPEFIQAIQETGLMEKVKEIILKAGTVEKEIVSELRFFGGMDNNKGKSFSPEELCNRLKGYFKNGLHHNRPQEQNTTRVKGGQLIG